MYAEMAVSYTHLDVYKRQVVAWAHYERRTHSLLIGIYRTMRIPKEISILMIKKGLPIFFNEFLWAGGLAALTQCCLLYTSRCV